MEDPVGGADSLMALTGATRTAEPSPIFCLGFFHEIYFVHRGKGVESPIGDVIRDVIGDVIRHVIGHVIRYVNS